MGLVICVTEVFRSQPQLTQPCVHIIRTVHRGCLPKQLRGGTSGQHVQQPCSFCSICSWREVTPPTQIPCTDGVPGHYSQTCVLMSLTEQRHTYMYMSQACALSTYAHICPVYMLTAEVHHCTVCSCMCT